MSLKLDPVITNAGRAEIVNASGSGLKLNLAYISIGDGNGAGYSPTLGQTALKNERMREPITVGEKVDIEFHSQAEFNGTAVFPINEAAVHLEDGTIFAIYSGDTPLDHMLVGKTLITQFSFGLPDADADIVSFNVQHSFGIETQVDLANMALSNMLFTSKNTLKNLKQEGLKL